MPRRILRHVFANKIQVLAPAAGKGFKFAGNQRKDFEEFVRSLYRRVDQDLPSQGHSPRLGEKGKGETSSQTKAVLLVPPTAGKTQFEFGGKFGSRRNIGEVCRLVKNSRRSSSAIYDAAKLTVRQSHPLPGRRLPRRKAKGRAFPLPLGRGLLLERNHTDGE